MYDFENYVDRSLQGAFKWDLMKKANPNVKEGVVPMTVADMDFKNAPEIINGLKDYLDKVVLGYTEETEAYIESVKHWLNRHHGFSLESNWITVSTGILNDLFAIIRGFSNENDGVIIFTPAYPPYYSFVEAAKRHYVKCPLIDNHGYYKIDFDLFSSLAKQKENKIFILCNPFNPVGRIFNEEEMKTLGDICLKNDVLVVVDEIHNDFVMPNYTHKSFATINDNFLNNSITLTSPTKTFNLAGMKLNNTIIANKYLREKYLSLPEIMTTRGQVSTLAYKACEIAYNECEEWLKELIQVIDTNQRLVRDFFKENIPQIKTYPLEGTYLLWTSWKELFSDEKELKHFLEIDCQAFFDEGSLFGEDYSCFERISLTCPTKVLRQTLERIKDKIR